MINCSKYCTKIMDNNNIKTSPLQNEIVLSNKLNKEEAKKKIYTKWAIHSKNDIDINMNINLHNRLTCLNILYNEKEKN